MIGSLSIPVSRMEMNGLNDNELTVPLGLSPKYSWWLR